MNLLSTANRAQERNQGVPTSVPSIRDFRQPGATFPGDLARNPTQVVAFWLLRDIVRGVFEPLERIKVVPLSKFYGVGHRPVREAILLASFSGLLVHEHQKGYRVAPVSVADYEDVRMTYMRIYRLALGLALQNGDDAWEERVVVQLHRSVKVRKVLLDGDPEAREMWQRAYHSLHEAMLSGCGSPLLISIYHSLRNRLERYINLFADLELDRGRDNHVEHREIVDALVARDQGRVEEVADRFFALGAGLRDSIISSLGKAAPAGGRRRRIAAKT